MTLENPCAPKASPKPVISLKIAIQGTRLGVGPDRRGAEGSVDEFVHAGVGEMDEASPAVKTRSIDGVALDFFRQQQREGQVRCLHQDIPGRMTLEHTAASR